MARNLLDRVWSRISDHYGDDGDGCCPIEIEETQFDSESDDGDSCCD